MTDEELIGRMHEISYEYPAILNYLITRHRGHVKYIVSTLGGIMPSDMDDYEQEGITNFREFLTDDMLYHMFL